MILGEVVGKLPKFQDENLLVGVETSDDGAVYRISEDLAMIQTLDFFPPMVDEPYVFGQAAAAGHPAAGGQRAGGDLPRDAAVQLLIERLRRVGVQSCRKMQHGSILLWQLAP